MGKRKKKKSSGTLLWKAVKGLFHWASYGLVKSLPALLIAAVGFGIFWGIRENLYADPGFMIQTVKILPENGLSPEKTRELENLYLNQNLFKISPRRVSEVVERDPKIRQAHVVREFPKTLIIEIRDRYPFTQIQFSSEGEFYSLSEDGVVLTRDSARNKNLLLIEAFETNSPKLTPGSEIKLPGFKEAVGLVKDFSRQPVSGSEVIDRIRLDHLGSVNLVLSKGPELRLGREPQKKLKRLNSVNSLLKSSDRDKIVYIDLQYQDLVVRKK